MERLIELAKKIKDEKLREKVISLLKEPGVSNKDFKKYKPESFENVKTLFSVGGVISERGDLITHTKSVTEICIEIAENLEENYKIPIEKDVLIAGALLHDIMKCFEWKTTERGAERTEILLDHSILGAAELYARGFPEKVIHLVASHIGETGPTPPRTIEAIILHTVDSFVSLIEFYVYGPKQTLDLPFVIVDESAIKKLSGDS